MRPNKYTHGDEANSIHDITENETSVRAAAQKHGVPKQTFSARIKGRIPARETEQPGQLLTRLEEERIAEWIKHQE